MSLERMSRLIAGGLFLAWLLPGVAVANDLIDVYHLAQTRDPKFLSAKAQRDTLLEQRPQALAVLLPQLTAQASYERNRLHDYDSDFRDPDTGVVTSAGIEHFNDKTYGLTLQQTLFDWQQFKTLEQADALVAEAQAAFRAAEQELLFRVADAYLTALNAEDTLRSDQDAHLAYAQQREAAQKKFQSGLATITDVRNAQASFDASEANLIADQRTLDSARRALTAITGEPVTSTATLAEEIPLESPDPASEADWVKAALDNNPALESYVHAADAARKSIDAAGGAFYPRVSLVGSVARSDSDYTFGSDRLVDSVGVQATWNLFSGGSTASKVREAQATHERTLFDLEGQKRSVDKLTRDAYEGVISGIASVKATNQAVNSFKTSLEASTIGLKVGARTQADVLDAQRDLSNSRRQFYASRYDYLRNVLALRQQAGSLREQDLERVDRLLVADTSVALQAPPSQAIPEPSPIPSAGVAPPAPLPVPEPTASIALQSPPSAPPPVVGPTIPTVPVATPSAPHVRKLETWRKEADGTLVLLFPAGRAKLSQEQVDWLTGEAAALGEQLVSHGDLRLVLTGSADRGSDGADAAALAARRAAVAREVLAGASLPVPRMALKSDERGARGDTAELRRRADIRFEKAPAE